MNDKLRTKPLDENTFNWYGWLITLSPDGLGLVIEAPEGKRLSMVDGRFVVSEGGKRLEVRAK